MYKELQTNLLAKGFDPGSIDGLWGPATLAALLAFVANRKVDDNIRQIAGAGVRFWPQYLIDSPLRISHFVGQAAHETEGFRLMHEIWGPTPAQTRYEGRADLGNTSPGDGKLFRGRGIFQLTGRSNYKQYGEKLGLDLVNQPELAATPEVSVKVAGLYWQNRKLNVPADANDVRAVTKLINGGLNGLPDRINKVNRALSVFGLKEVE
jgi:putative chitinase